MGSAHVHAQVFDASVCLYCFLQYAPKREYYKEEKHEEVRLLTASDWSASPDSHEK
jgi:hypothetical protein